MENEPQAVDRAAAPENPTPSRDRVDPARQVFASDGSRREARVGEPAVGTDGQIVEAGYGHGV
jgi:hypothetical protein